MKLKHFIMNVSYFVVLVLLIQAKQGESWSTILMMNDNDDNVHLIKAADK